MNIDGIKTFEINTLADFVGARSWCTPGKHWIFRGQSKLEGWKLRPKAGRENYSPNYVRAEVDATRPLGSLDLQRFTEWRRQAVAYCGDRLPKDDFECLAYAQHYGLATRLLDWSTNPLVALFFAVESDPDETGIVYCYATSAEIRVETLETPISRVCFYRPRPFDRRILAQQGVFTYHPDPSAEFPIELLASQLEPDPKPFWNLASLTIPGRFKMLVMRELSEVGITRNTLFPDLEGLSKFINWEFEVEVLRRNQIASDMLMGAPPLFETPD